MPSTMVTRLRSITGSTATDFSDAEVQDFLTTNSTDYVREWLTAASSDGTTYDKFGAETGNWEAGAVFRDSANAIVTTGLTFEVITGIVTAAPPRTESILTITGRAYDIYGAAAELMETWANKLSQEYDVSLDGNTYNRSQKADGLRAAAASFRRKSRTRVGTTERNDERWTTLEPFLERN
jgi:hypothetical protein